MNKYQTYFKKPYEELEKTLSEVECASSILDLGSNSGTIASILDKYDLHCYVHCVDIDKIALKQIDKNSYKTTGVKIHHADANEFLSESYLNDLDYIILNATLHEINNPEDQRSYLSYFFEECKSKLNDNGKIIIGDYYYADDVSDEAVKEYMQQQMREINHADSREKFVKPSLIREVAEELGFCIEKEIEIPAVEGIDRRYYNIIIRGDKNENN